MDDWTKFLLCLGLIYGLPFIILALIIGGIVGGLIVWVL